MIGVLIKARLYEEIDTGKGHVKTEDWSNVLWANECQRSPANYQKLEKVEIASLSVVRGSMALPTP